MSDPLVEQQDKAYELAALEVLLESLCTHEARVAVEISARAHTTLTELTRKVS